MSKTLVLIGVGGLLGSVCRYLVSLYITKQIPSAFPYGTFIVNLTGCFLIGVIAGLSQRYNWLTPEWRFFLTTGFCGGFTTFSSFAFENTKLLQAGQYFTFGLYSVASFALGIVAVFAGLAISK